MGIVNHVVVVLVYVIAARSIAHGAINGVHAVRARRAADSVDARRARILTLEVAAGEQISTDSLEWLLSRPAPEDSPSLERNCLCCGAEYRPVKHYDYVYHVPAADYDLKRRVCRDCYPGLKTVIVS